MPKRLALLLLCCITLPTLAEPPRTFAEAKKIAWSLYAQQSVEFYCGCRYNGNRVDLKSCGYQPRKNPQRAARIEWEHLVPAWVIGHQRRICGLQRDLAACHSHGDADIGPRQGCGVVHPVADEGDLALCVGRLHQPDLVARQEARVNLVGPKAEPSADGKVKVS